MRSRATAVLGAAVLAAAGCGTPAVQPVDAGAVLSAPGVRLEPAEPAVVERLRRGLREQVTDERLHDVAVRRIVEDGRDVGIALAATFVAELDPAVADGFVAGALDGEEPRQRREVRLADGAPLTLFRSRSGFGGAVWVRSGTVGMVLTPTPGRAEPLARRLAGARSLPGDAA